MAYSLVERWAAPQEQGRASAWLGLPLLWMLRLSWRSELSDLDLDQMRDCGLDPEAVQTEAHKPFWRA